MYDFLKKVALFTDLPEQDLARLCEMMEDVELKAGAELFAEGSRGDRAFIIRSGELEVIKVSGNRSVLLSVRGAGDVIGEMAILEDAPRNASVRARSDSQLYAINQEQFEKLLNSSPTASRVLLNTVLTRFRSTSAMLRQSEKMAQLGALTAGVAHELNNPAAAVQRGAGQLEEILQVYAEAQARLDMLDLGNGQRQIVDRISRKVHLAALQPAVYLDPLARSDREYELENWMEAYGLTKAWEWAPALVSLGYDAADLGKLAEYFTPETLGVVMNWLGAAHTAYSLLAEIGQGATRISEIVKALKTYAYLDQAPVQEVDLHQDLDNTLLMMRPKLTNLKVRREYAPDLPHIQAFGSELNQVWTNIIDNAADALENTSGGQITLRTISKPAWVWVEIEDNGPGIPPEAMPRIYEPFFTTKPPGKGTGLGLEISYNIVVNKHRGEIKVFSEPGKTIFRVELPVNFEAVLDARGDDQE